MHESLFDDLAALVALNTQNPGGDEATCARWLAERLAHAQPTDLHVTRISQGNAFVFATWGTPRLLINIHIDTVPAVRSWSSDPLVLRRAGSRVVGLGVTDVKGAIAALLQALRSTTPKDCAILLSGDEEKDSKAMAHFLAHKLPPTLRDAVVCEPTGGAVGVRHRGMCAMEAMATGPGGHSSQADHRAGPIASLCLAAASLTAWGKARGNVGPEGFKGLCLNIANITGGVDYNIIPTEARLVFSLRPAPGDDIAALNTEVRGLIAKAAPDITVRDTLMQPAFATANTSAVLDRFGRAKTAGVDLPFWTEAALLADKGINTVVWGPGHIEQAHSADEFIEMSELEATVKVFERLLVG